ncbi:hypothetical protein [Deinococcus marmoris]|uniref:hypothetical protein n=1 Tax=Deinococcus marmoris TaxID=249408 RepID=UPI00096A5C0C|nr:hypothetical protein [Deinococcus marmoris]
MPTKVELFSLNKAADECGISRQDFRQYVGEFERQSGTYLPKDPQGNKQIPEDFLQFFQRAVMWSRVEGILPTTAMRQALGDGYSFRLNELAKAVVNTNQLLKLPGELRTVVQELERLSRRERPVKIILADEVRIARALTSIRLWQAGGCVLAGGLLERLLASRFGW